jgi:glutathione S-transferase
MTTTTTEASSPSPEWTVLYHAPGTFKGRGEFLRLMLEDRGASYVDSGDGLYGPDGMMDMFRGTEEAIANEEKESNIPFPLLYPPAIWHRPQGGEEVMVNQVGACMIYLGDALGYAPVNAAEKARANAVLLNCTDYIADGRSSFHPVKFMASYKDQKEEGDRVSKEFSQDRMKKYLRHFNKVVLKNGSNQPVAGGPNITYADFALFHVLDATAHQFNSDFYEKAWDNTDVPALKEFHAWMDARPNLQAYFQSDRCARTYDSICSVSTVSAASTFAFVYGIVLTRALFLFRNHV